MGWRHPYGRVQQAWPPGGNASDRPPKPADGLRDFLLALERAVFRPSPARPVLDRARLLLLGAFALSGLVVFSWLARIPSIRDALGLSPAELGAILLVGSIGGLLTVFSSSALLTRFGSTRVFATGAVVMSVGFVLMGVGTAFGSRWLFLLAIVINGVGGAMLNVPMNIESARIEQAYGRTVIPHFHAAFSGGAVAGAVLGAGSASAGVPVVVQFAVVAIVVGGLRLAALAGGMMLPGGQQPTRRTQSRRANLAAEFAVWTEPRTVLIGVVAFAAALSEGAANNWLALAFVDGFGTTEATGGLALGVFIGSMTLVRVLGTRLIDRLGRVISLQLSGLLGVLGLALFGLASNPLSAVAGVALWGAGAALCFPIAVAAASDDPVRAAARVSVIASLGSVAVMTAAPLIGFVAEALGGAQHALLVVLLGLMVSLAVSRKVAPEIAAYAAGRASMPTGPEPQQVS